MTEMTMDQIAETTKRFVVSKLEEMQLPSNVTVTIRINSVNPNAPPEVPDSVTINPVHPDCGDCSVEMIGEMRGGPRPRWSSPEFPKKRYPARPGYLETIELTGFGSKVKRFTDVKKTSEQMGSGFSWRNHLEVAYSTHHAFSADGNYIASNGAGNRKIIWNRDGSFNRVTNVGGRGVMLWMNTEPHSAFCLNDNGSNNDPSGTHMRKLHKINPFTDRVEVLRTFPYRIDLGGSDGRQSDDDERIAFVARPTHWDVPNNAGDDQQMRVICYDIKNDKINADKTLPYKTGDVGGLTVTPSGKYVAFTHKRRYLIYDWDLNFVREVDSPAQHGDFGWDENGDECLYMVGFIESYGQAGRTSVGKWRLRDGKYTLLLGHPDKYNNNAASEGESLSGHLSARATSISPEFVTVSLLDPAGPYTVFRLKTDGSQKVQNIAWCSDDNSLGYYCQPKAATNRDGSLVVFRSNWGAANGDKSDPALSYMAWFDDELDASGIVGIPEYGVAQIESGKIIYTPYQSTAAGTVDHFKCTLSDGARRRVVDVTVTITDTAINVKYN